MSADARAERDRALVAWLARQRAALDPASPVVIRGVDGHVVVELPRNGREVDEITSEQDLADTLRESASEEPAADAEREP